MEWTAGYPAVNLATQNALHPLHGMSVDINKPGQNRVPVQVQHLGAGTGATCKRVVIVEGEDSAVTHCHGADHPFRSVHRNDVAIAKKKVSIPACLGEAGVNQMVASSTSPATVCRRFIGLLGAFPLRVSESCRRVHPQEQGLLFAEALPAVCLCAFKIQAVSCL